MPPKSNQIQSARLVETESSSAAVSELSVETEALRREVALSRAEAEASLREVQEEKEALVEEIEGLKVGLVWGRCYQLPIARYLYTVLGFTV